MGMVILGLMVLGLVGYSRMPWDRFPQIDFPFISITVPYPGAGPEEVEQQIVKPLEDQVSIINNVDRVESSCQENLGGVFIRFKYGTDLDAAASDVRDAIDRARISFPKDAKTPQLFKLNIASLPVIIAGITGDRPPRELRRIVDEEIKPRLGAIPGVASVSVTGGEEREIQIRVKQERLDAVGLSLSALSQYLAAANLKIPAGNLKEGLRDYTVRVMGEFGSMEEIRRLQVPTPAGGLVRLDTLAEVLDTTAEPTSISRINRNPAVTVNILKQADANTVAVCDRARAELEFLLGTEGKPGLLPPDLKATIALDGSERVRESIKDVADALMWGAVLASLVVFLFLHNLRATIIVALAIPTSIVATFLPTGIGLGFTLNMMVLLGLALSVGILVDDSIVILENIQRHLDAGEQPATAAYNGRTEIGAAAVAITLVDVVVFVPVALMGGIVGQFFYSFGITVAVCTLFSLFVSFTLTPSLAAWWFRRRDEEVTAAGGLRRLLQALFEGWDRGFTRLQNGYRRALRGAISHPWFTLLVAYGALAFALVVIMPRLGFGMFPVVDEGQISIDIESSPGTRLEYTDTIVQAIEERLADKQQYPEIKDMSATVGLLGGAFLGAGDVGGQYGNVYLALHKRRARVRAGQRSDVALAEDLRRALADIPGATIKVNTVQGMGGGAGQAPLQLQFLSNDLTQLSRVAEEMRRKVAQVPGLLYVDTSSKPGRPEVRVRIDRERLADLGLTVAQVGADLRTAFAGMELSKYREMGEEYDLRLELAEANKRRVADVGEAVLGVTKTGQVVRVRDVATISMSTGPSRIDRANRQRTVTLSAYYDPNVLNLRAAQREIDRLVEETDLGDVTASWSGQVEMFKESFGFLGQALLLSVVLVYMLAAALYNSVLEPFNIMFTLPVAIVGAALALLLANMLLSIISMIGIIMLMGIVGKNSILVVDYTNTLRARGLSRFEALLEAGPTRMKPVLMTSLAMIMGSLPTALAVNEGSEFRAPMAVAIIGGLTLATAVSLLLVPATYVIWDTIAEFFTRTGRRIFGRRRAPDRRVGEESSEGGEHE